MANSEYQASDLCSGGKWDCKIRNCLFWRLDRKWSVKCWWSVELDRILSWKSEYWTCTRIVQILNGFANECFLNGLSEIRTKIRTVTVKSLLNKTSLDQNDLYRGRFCLFWRLGPNDLNKSRSFVKMFVLKTLIVIVWSCLLNKASLDHEKVRLQDLFAYLKGLIWNFWAAVSEKNWLLSELNSDVDMVLKLSYTACKIGGACRYGWVKGGSTNNWT